MSRPRENSKLDLNDVDNSPEFIRKSCNKYLRSKKIDIDAEGAVTNLVLIDMVKTAFDLHMTQVQCREAQSQCHIMKNKKQIAKANGANFYELSMIPDVDIDVFCLTKFSNWLSKNMTFMHYCKDSKFSLPA